MLNARLEILKNNKGDIFVNTGNRKLYDEIIEQDRIVITQDKYNWILHIGRKNWNDITYFKKATNWYFNDIYSLLKRLQILFFKNKIKSFELNQIRKVIQSTEITNREIADKIIVAINSNNQNSIS